MPKPVYYENDNQEENPTRFESRLYEVRIHLEERFIELDADERNEIYDLTKRLNAKLHFLGSDYSAEVTEITRTTDLDGDEHIPTLEHVLQYLRDKGEPETSRFIAEKTGALYKRVYGNSIW